jgi:hypothetical protein
MEYIRLREAHLTRIEREFMASIGVQPSDVEMAEGVDIDTDEELL